MDLSAECAQELGDDILQFGVCRVGDLTVGGDLREERLFVCLDVLQEFLLEFGDLGRVHFVQVATDTAVDDGNLDFGRKARCKHLTRISSRGAGECRATLPALRWPSARIDLASTAR